MFGVLLMTTDSLYKSHGFTSLILESGKKSTPLLELYTSEGCNGCPPAEAWLSGLKNNSDLWKKIVPIAFHVDCWNSLGWPDPYSSDLFTKRQRSYATAWGTPTVDTPEFVLNGREWRPAKLSVASTNKDVGKLRACINAEGKVEVTFEPSGRVHGPFVAEASFIADGVSTSVPRGEDAGRTLTHDFLSIGSHELCPVTIGKGEAHRNIHSASSCQGSCGCTCVLGEISGKPDADPVTRWMVER